jgi:anti-sigma factor RsiW
MHIADNHDALLDYLYEEGDSTERLKIAQHLQQCATCSVAVLEFQRVRGILSSWEPPVAELGFRMVQDRDNLPGEESPEHGARRGWLWGLGIGAKRENSAPTGAARWGGLAAWAQVAAAVLLFLAGMAVSQLDVDYSNGSLTVSIPDARPLQGGRTASIVLPAVSPVTAPPEGSSQTLAELERALRERLASSDSPSVDHEQLLQRVRAMIDQSEQRQQRELALRLSQVAQEVDTQHQADLLRIQQDFGQTQELMEYLVRTSGGVK